jgi:hypothetical protein
MANNGWTIRRTAELQELWPNIKAKAALEGRPLVQIINEAILRWYREDDA